MGLLCQQLICQQLYTTARARASVLLISVLVGPGMAPPGLWLSEPSTPFAY
jgi:hypothetical protein